MELFRILPLLIHIIILLKFGYDVVSLHAGIMSKDDMASIKDLYYIFLYVLMLSVVASCLLKERRLRIMSILAGVLAFAAVWFSDKTFTPEYHTSPLYMPAEESMYEEEMTE